MKSSILPNFTTFDVNSNKLDLCEIAVHSDSDNKYESDYSLSDIEEGLYTRSVTSCKQSQAKCELAWSQVDLSIPVKVRDPSSLNLRAFVKYDDESCASKKCKGHKRIGSDTVTLPNKQMKSTTTWLRRRALRLPVKQETALQGARVISRQLSNQSSLSSPDKNSSTTEQSETSNIPESDKCASPLRTPVSNSGENFQSSNPLLQTPSKKPTLRINACVADNNFELRQRSSTHGGSSQVPIVQRARSSSLRPTLTRDASQDAFKQSNAASRSLATVKSLKHYQRAMEAYRRSAEKAFGASENSYANSLPSRGTRSNFERDSLFEFLGSRPSYASPESDDKLSESDRSSGISAANDDDITSMRRWPFVPMSGDVRSKFGDENSLNLDYRTALRHGSLRRTGSSCANLSSAKHSPNRKSIDPEVVTDIDSIVGLGASDNVDFDNDGKLNSPEDRNASTNSRDREEPEKIVWSGYEKYLRAKEDPKQFPRSSIKMRLAAMEKKGIDSRSLKAMEYDLSPSSTLKPVQDEESPYVNLRDNRIIRKRNLSRSNSSQSSSQSETQTLPRDHDLTAFKSHTIATPARISRLLLKQSSKLSPVYSPSLARPERSFSLKENAVRRQSSVNAEKISNLDAITFGSRNTVVGDCQFPLYYPLSMNENRSASDNLSHRLSNSLPRRKSSKVTSLTISDATVTSPDNVVSNSDKTALCINKYRSTVTSDSVIYDVPRSYRFFRKVSTVSSALEQPANQTTRSERYQDNVTTVSSDSLLSQPSPNVATSPSLQFAKAVADGRIKSQSRFTPGKYPSFSAESDSDHDDYVSFDSYYKAQPQSSILKKEKLQSPSANDVSAENKSEITFSKSNSNRSQVVLSNFSKSSDALNDKENYQTSRKKLLKKRSTPSDRSKKIGSGFFSRSVSALDIFNSNASPGGSSVALRLPKMLLSKDKRRFTSTDLFYGSAKKQSKLTKHKSFQVSVPLTNLLNEPRAAFNLTLANDPIDAREKAETMRRISNFISDESVQKVDGLCKIFEEKSKSNEEKRATLKLLANVSRVLRSHRIATKSGTALIAFANRCFVCSCR